MPSPPTNPPIRFGSLDGEAVLYSGVTEAWLFSEDKGAWLPANVGEVAMGARMLSKSDFERIAPSLPPLPANAFPSS